MLVNWLLTKAYEPIFCKVDGILSLLILFNFPSKAFSAIAVTPWLAELLGKVRVVRM